MKNGLEGEAGVREVAALTPRPDQSSQPSECAPYACRLPTPILHEVTCEVFQAIDKRRPWVLIRSRIEVMALPILFTAFRTYDF